MDCLTPDVCVTFHQGEEKKEGRESVMNWKRCNGSAYSSRVTVKLGKHSITITSNLLLLLICVMQALIKMFHYIKWGGLWSTSALPAVIFYITITGEKPRWRIALNYSLTLHSFLPSTLRPSSTSLLSPSFLFFPLVFVLLSFFLLIEAWGSSHFT